MADQPIDLALDAPPAVRWEPCGAFAADGTGDHECGDCGWLLDDHAVDATIRHLRVRAPRTARPQRLAS